ncbi:hypothetical protein MSG28_004359, partial [Choristoneura fumiferana]
ETRTFNTTAGGVTRGDCNKHSCSISVVLPKKYNTRISYMCEVSTEGPRFAVVKQTKNLTVAVALNQDPVITGLPSSVSFGEDVLVNCTTAPAMPPANIFEPWVVDNTEVTEADSDGLRRSWRPLKIKITSGRFVSLRCEAMQPTHPPYMRSTNASLTVARSPHLGMFTASGYKSSLSYSMICGPLKIKVMSGRFVSFRCEATQATHPPYPETRTFNTTAGGVTRGDCNKHSCSISVVLPKKYNTRISYMCEVSTEGPRFAVVKQTKNLTVAVALNQDPVITGLPSSVSFGEDVLVNCTTAPAMPPANIFEPWVVDNTEVTEADSDGLRRSWRPLKIKITSGRFVSLRCEAMQPTHPPYMRSTNASLTVARSPHLGMFTASGSSNAKAVLIPVICAAVHIFSKSALSDV